MSNSAASDTISPGIASFLSFILPGLGQFQLGNSGAGAAFLIGGMLAYLVFPGLGLVVAIFAAINAHDAASKLRAQASLREAEVYQSPRIDEAFSEPESDVQTSTGSGAQRTVSGLLVPPANPKPEEPGMPAPLNDTATASTPLRLGHGTPLRADLMLAMLARIRERQQEGALNRQAAQHARAALAVDLALYGSPDSDEAILNRWQQARQAGAASSHDLNRVRGALKVRPHSITS